MGRVFRRYENANGPVKTRVNICNYIPEFAKPVQGATLEDVMADRVNAILFLIQVNEMVHPLRIPSLQGERKNRFLSEIFGTSYQRAKEEFLKRVDKLEKKSAKEISAIAQQIFDEYGINENREALTDSFLVLSLRAASPELRQFGIDVKFLREQGFNQLLKKYDLERKSIFFADCSQKEWQTIRALTEQSWEKAFRELQQKGIPL